MTTPKEIAEWMVAQIEDVHELRLKDAVRKLIGSEFLYCDDGHAAIDRRILYQFRKLTEDSVVWVSQKDKWYEGFWRKRKVGDAPGRTQIIASESGDDDEALADRDKSPQGKVPSRRKSIQSKRKRRG